MFTFWRRSGNIAALGKEFSPRSLSAWPVGAVES
jgi:hypothetical protein